uniref:NADH dehydrogenase subunit 2 n=1 Tax=Trapezia rufopunctata TaxID=399052 RepID=UPI0028D342AA|nr:NADH dehydrogenase subunit 2 [Trapezia rufopunctata]WMQ53233.1 NADH dehydrogenase subunit 2 [Trapezia rufopunctata]
MIFPLSSLFFFFTLILGSLLTMSSSSWFGMWIGLELNLLSFIPLILVKMNSYFSETALKYFLIQALGSTFIITSSCLYLSLLSLVSPLILMALLMKLGAAPFHFWFPHIMEGLSWPQAFILLSIQKLAPMYMLSYLTSNMNMIFLSAILSSLIGALGGLNVLSLRKIMAFSSINHMSWMLIAILTSDFTWLTYFSFYVMISLSIIIFFNYIQVYYFSDLLNLSYSNFYLTLLLPLNLLSLGGLPPFTGFIPKWFMIQNMLENKMIFTLIFLIISALITLYYYLRVLTPFILFFNPSSINTIKSYPLHSPIFISSFLFNIIGILLPIPFLF